MDIKTERRVVEEYRAEWRRVIGAMQARDHVGQEKAKAFIEGMRRGLAAAGIDSTVQEWRGWSMAYEDMGYEWNGTTHAWEEAAPCSR